MRKNLLTLFVSLVMSANLGLAFTIQSPQTGDNKETQRVAEEANKDLQHPFFPFGGGQESDLRRSNSRNEKRTLENASEVVSVKTP